MRDEKIHRVVAVNDAGTPVGVLSSMDFVARSTPRDRAPGTSLPCGVERLSATNRRHLARAAGVLSHIWP